MLIPLLIPQWMPDCGHPAEGGTGSTGDTGWKRYVGQLQILSGAEFLSGNVVPIVEVIGTPEDPVRLGTGTIGDVDGDGLAEIGVQTGRGVRMISGALVRGGGSVDSASLPVVTDPASTVDWPVYPGGDLTGDGVPDLLVAASTGAPTSAHWVEVYSGAGLQRGDLPVARILYGPIHPIGGGWGPPLSGDLDGDGVHDLVLNRGWGSGDEYYVDAVVLVGPFAGDRDVDQPDTVIAPGIWAASVADTDGDGRDDLAAMDADRFYIFDGPVLASQDVVASDARSTWAAPYPNIEALKDLDGDGKADLLAQTSGRRVVQSATSPEGLFDLTIRQGVWGAVVGDFDGDGVPNLAFFEGAPGAPTVSVFGALLLDGREISSADAVGSIPIGHGTSVNQAAAALGDVDGDGTDDLALVDPEYPGD